MVREFGTNITRSVEKNQCVLEFYDCLGNSVNWHTPEPTEIKKFLTHVETNNLSCDEKYSENEQTFTVTNDTIFPDPPTIWLDAEYGDIQQKRLRNFITALNSTFLTDNHGVDTKELVKEDSHLVQKSIFNTIKRSFNTVQGKRRDKHTLLCFNAFRGIFPTESVMNERIDAYNNKRNKSKEVTGEETKSNELLGTIIQRFIAVEAIAEQTKVARANRKADEEKVRQQKDKDNVVAMETEKKNKDRVTSDRIAKLAEIKQETAANKAKEDQKAQQAREAEETEEVRQPQQKKNEAQWEKKKARQARQALVAKQAREKKKTMANENAEKARQAKEVRKVKQAADDEANKANKARRALREQALLAKLKKDKAEEAQKETEKAEKARKEAEKAEKAEKAEEARKETEKAEDAWKETEKARKETEEAEKAEKAKEAEKARLEAERLEAERLEAEQQAIYHLQYTEQLAEQREAKKAEKAEKAEKAKEAETARRALLAKFEKDAAVAEKQLKFYERVEENRKKAYEARKEAMEAEQAVKEQERLDDVNRQTVQMLLRKQAQAAVDVAKATKEANVIKEQMMDGLKKSGYAINSKQYEEKLVLIDLKWAYAIGSTEYNNKRFTDSLNTYRTVANRLLKRITQPTALKIIDRINNVEPNLDEKNAARNMQRAFELTMSSRNYTY